MLLLQLYCTYDPVGFDGWHGGSPPIVPQRAEPRAAEGAPKARV
jgi:hypothetical protein